MKAAWVSTGVTAPLEVVQLYRHQPDPVRDPHPEVEIWIRSYSGGVNIRLDLSSAHWLQEAIGKCLAAVESADPEKTGALHEEKPQP